MCEFPRSCKFYAHNIRKCIGYKFYCILGKTVTQCPLIASLYLPVCTQVSYNSIASLLNSSRVSASNGMNNLESFCLHLRGRVNDRCRLANLQGIKRPVSFI